MVCIAFNLRRAPIRPTEKRRIPPIICPSIKGIQIDCTGAAEPSCIPAIISETEMATPNHITAFVKSPVRFAIVDH